MCRIFYRSSGPSFTDNMFFKVNLSQTYWLQSCYIVLQKLENVLGNSQNGLCDILYVLTFNGLYNIMYCYKLT